MAACFRSLDDPATSSPESDSSSRDDEESCGPNAQLGSRSRNWETKVGGLFRRLGFRIISEDVEQGFRQDVEAGESGGEGVVLVLEARASSQKTSALIWQLVWSRAIAPAPMVWLIFLCFSIYAIVVVTLLELFYPPHPVNGNVEILAFATITLLGSAVFLMIGYRINASYDRWWEARKHWGTITNRTRDVARQALAWIAPKNWVIVEQIVRWSVAYAEVTKNHLRYEDHTEALEGVLSPEDIDDLKRCKHQPILAMEKISDLLSFAHRQGLITDIQAMRFDENITSFEDELGASERILRTSLPFAYVVHVRVITLLWLGVLPFASISVLHYFTIPMSIILAYTLLVLEDTGCDIEEPYAKNFNALPLNLIVRNIQNNLLEMLERKRRTWGPPSEPGTNLSSSPHRGSLQGGLPSTSCTLSGESFSSNGLSRRDSFTRHAVEEDDMARARIRRTATPLAKPGMSLQAEKRQIVWTGRGEKARLFMEESAKLRKDVQARLRRISLTGRPSADLNHQMTDLRRTSLSKSHHGEVTVNVCPAKPLSKGDEKKPAKALQQDITDTFTKAPRTIRRSFSYTDDKDSAAVLQLALDESSLSLKGSKSNPALQPLDNIPEGISERTASSDARRPSRMSTSSSADEIVISSDEIRIEVVASEDSKAEGSGPASEGE